MEKGKSSLLFVDHQHVGIRGARCFYDRFQFFLNFLNARVCHNLTRCPVSLQRSVGITVSDVLDLCS